MAHIETNQHGFEHVTLAIVIVVLVAVGVVGYRVASKPNSTAKISPITKTTTTSASSTLKTKSDITSAKNSLSSEQVETDLNPAQLDKDLSDLR